jgi:SAM-dependent methyltransferase
MRELTWQEFWGEFLLLRFHQDNSQLWELRQQKAQWVWDTSGLVTSATVLDLGCGDGLLDVCLAQMGASVVAVDRLSTVLSHARQIAEDAPATFLESDVRVFTAGENSFDLVILFEVLGLMSTEDDACLLRRVFGWLRPGGVILLDSPLPPQPTESHLERETRDGFFTLTASYDPQTRLQRLSPRLLTTAGTTITLRDPYDPGRGDHEGVLRYIYDKEQLVGTLTTLGFAVQEHNHYSSPHHYLLVGHKPEGIT